VQIPQNGSRDEQQISLNPDEHKLYRLQTRLEAARLVSARPLGGAPAMTVNSQITTETIDFTPSDVRDDDAFCVEQVGDLWVIIPSPRVESLQWELIEEASELLVAPFCKLEGPQVVVDLKEVDYFGSVFLSLLLRIERCVRRSAGAMAVCGASPRARELLRITNLDTIWAIYDDRSEALAALRTD
jgi:anti-sigma B factor antagonist